MLKKYAGLIITAMISSLLGCAAFFYVVVPWLTQPAPDAGDISLQETVPAATIATLPPETEPEGTIPETEPDPTLYIPEDVNLETLVWTSPSLVRGYICTWDQAVEYMDSRFPVLNRGWDGGWSKFKDSPDGWGMIKSGDMTTNRFPDATMCRNNIPTCITYLLSDNMEIYTCFAFWHDFEPYDGLCPPKTINCIKTEDGYEFRDPLLGMQGDLDTRVEPLLPEAKVKTLEEYFEILESIPEFAEQVDAFYILPHGCFFELEWDSQGIVTAIDPGEDFASFSYTPPYLSRDLTPTVEPLWGNNVENKQDALSSPLTVNSGWLPHENLYSISSFDLYHHLGGTTLTAEEAIALTCEAPEVVQERVKTAADVLMYLMAANVIAGPGCYCTDWDGDVWHTSPTAQELMAYREGGCGSCANLGNYLLKGDYEEVGFIDHALRPGEAGSHIYNYIFYAGKYYIVDFSHYMFAEYSLEYPYPIPVMDSLEEWGEIIQRRPYNDYYTNVDTIVCYKSTGRQLPVIFSDFDFFDPDGAEKAKVFEAVEPKYYFPEGAEYTLLYDAPGGYEVAQKPFNWKYYDWTVFWVGAGGTNTP